MFAFCFFNLCVHPAAGGAPREVEWQAAVAKPLGVHGVYVQKAARA